MFLFPHVLILVELAAANVSVSPRRRSAGEAGKTDIAAPESARYARPVFASYRVKHLLPVIALIVGVGGGSSGVTGVPSETGRGGWESGRNLLGVR